LKTKKVYSIDNPNYIQLVKDNPDIAIFLTIVGDVDNNKYCNIDYACQLFYPFYQLQKAPIFIQVRHYYTTKLHYPRCIEYSIHMQFNSSVFSQFLYKLNYFLIPTTYYKHNYYQLECLPLNTQEPYTIYEQYYHSYYKVYNDDQILGFISAIANHNFRVKPCCGNCRYFVNSIHLSCTVRPGHKWLCDDYIQR
jgi:hypothetical protein